MNAYQTALGMRGRFNDPLLFIASSAESPRRTRIAEAIVNGEGVALSDDEILSRLVEWGVIGADFAANSKFVEYYLPIYKAVMEFRRVLFRSRCSPDRNRRNPSRLRARSRSCEERMMRL